MNSKEEEYKEIFLAEALENFEDINRVLTQLEKSPDDRSHIDTLFRITHTLKGNANGMGFDNIGDLAHVMEDLFGEVRNGNIKLNADIFASLFKSVDILGALINAVKSGEKIAHRGIKTKLQVIVNRNKERATEEKSEKKSVESKKKKSTESAAEKKADKKTGKKTTGKKASKATDKEDTSKDLNELNEVLESSEDEEQDLNEIEVTQQENKITFSDLVQVPVRKLDNLLNLVGELIIERDRIIASHAYNGNSNEYTRLNRISSDLQYSVMDVRLVQVGFLFNKFHRVVRDAASVEGKQVKLELKGVDTEIDRNILQIISDSLIHLIRNCVSHGIESPEERKKVNKKTEGVISLSARNDNDGVLIEIKDDGKGINVQKVKEKALSSGLVNKDMLELMNKEELLMMVFEAGFSTKEEVSELSGRGVGMDVVKKAIDSIGGNIRIDTEDGEGTTISLKLPSSMAVKGTLLFMLGKQTYAIPLSYTEAVVSIYKSNLHKVSNGIVSTYLGKTISIVFLKHLFDIKADEFAKSGKVLQKGMDELHPEDQLDVVIVSYNGRTIGLVVDKLLQQKEIVEKPLLKPLDQIKLLSGVTILGDGNVCPVLNITAITNFIFNVSISNHKVI